MISGIFEVITIGYPFCAFKIISGLRLDQPWMVVWGLFDLVINSVNLIGFAIRGRQLLHTCLLSQTIYLVRRPGDDATAHWENLGNALDLLLSFVLVALMLGGGFLAGMDAGLLVVWNISVILNVLGAGSSRVSASIASLRKSR
jgi:hypothetical protein